MFMHSEQDWLKLYKISSEKKNSIFVIYLTGDFGLKNLKVFTEEIKQLIYQQKPQEISIDFSGISYLDSAAALAVIQIQKDAAVANINCSLVNLNEETKGIFSVIHEQALTKAPFKAKTRQDLFLIQVGESFLHLIRDFENVVTFVGELLSDIFIPLYIRDP